MSSGWLLALADLVLVVAVAHVGSRIARRLGQPRIAGELVAVVALGPTVLGGRIEGIVDGAAAAGTVGALFPPAAVTALTWAGGLGLILYMLLVGLAIDLAPMRRCGGVIAALAAAIVVPTAALATGVALSLERAGGWTAAGAATSAFVLILVAALIAHGLPIVARILEERGLLHSEVGVVAIVTGACVTTVALVLSGIAVEGGEAGAGLRIVATLGIAGAAGVAVARVPRAALPRWSRAPVLVGCAIAAGIVGKGLVGTALLGPLAVGVLVSGAGIAATRIEAVLGTVTRGVLLPLFLGVAALHTDLRELGAAELPAVAAIIVTVVAVKVVAGSAAARAGGFSAGDARAIGALLQCGGIITVAISLDGLQAGVVSTQTHALLTLVGLVTTVAAGPLLDRARPRARTRPPVPEGVA